MCRPRQTGPHGQSEQPIEGAHVYYDLNIRQYMALFSVADLFCGGTSGGSHIAAAFDLPAIIVTWRALLKGKLLPDRKFRSHKDVFFISAPPFPLRG